MSRPATGVGSVLLSSITETVYVRDIVYGEWTSIERATLTFVDGTVREFWESTVDFDAESITTTSPFEE